MATIKVKFRPSTVDGQEGTIYYQIIQNRKPRQLLTDYHLFPSEWDTERSSVIINKDTLRKSLMLSLRMRLRWDVERITRIIRNFDSQGSSYSAEDVINEFRKYAEENSLFNFMENIIINLKMRGKTRTAEAYTTALNNFKKFLISLQLTNPQNPKDDVLLDCLTSELMEHYQAWQEQCGLAPNTISFYIRIIRAVYNRALEEGLVDNHYPFRHVYTGIDKTLKRALPLTIIKKIKNIDLKASPTLNLARDMFMMSFMLRGMSFVDMAFLKKSDLINGYLKYRRKKTGQILTIEWTKEMQQILDRYPENASRYLLPIIINTGRNERCVYRNKSYAINRNLKIIARKIGLNIPLTLYLARHSWASIARSKGIPVSVISEGMGHSNEATTYIYLASLDSTAVDKANAVILSAL